MPSKGFNCRLQKYMNEEEQKQYNKDYANLRNTVCYWNKKFNFQLDKSDYEDFKKISRRGKQIEEIYEFLKTYKVGQLPKTPEELAFYNKHYKTIKFAEPHIHYIKTLQLKN